MSKNKLYFLSITSVAALAILFAFFVEYILGFEPCELCIYQRIPYYLLIVVGIAGFIAHQNKYLAYLISLIFFFAAILAGYHTGIERAWFAPSATCNPGFKMPKDVSVEEILEALYEAPVATCTKPAFKIFGFSMTEWNLFLNICLFFISLYFSKVISKRIHAKTIFS